jgi:phosphatidylserine decarboxylase
MWNLLKFLPRKFLSRLTGAFVHWRGPGFWARTSVAVFAGIYRINIGEAEKPLWDYPSIGDFFVRRLKPGARPVANAAAVHCSDSRILQSGPIVDGACVQAKGKKYSVQDFLVDPNWKEKFRDGYFVTYYLCPTDYHRVHSPVDGVIRKVTYVPGDLWPVHEGAVNEIEGLYLVNERVVIDIASDLGAVAVVLVGATNVGSIELSFENLIKGNRGLPFAERVYDNGKDIKKGDELGMFRMGSTVVVLFSEDFRHKFSGTLKLGPVVKVNSALTTG